MLENNFWQNKVKSQKIIKEKKLYEDLINSYNHSIKSLRDLYELNELAIEEKNQIHDFRSCQRVHGENGRKSRRFYWMTTQALSWGRSRKPEA